MDLFRSELKLPETVYVVCPGPNGLKHHADIPPDACVVACNYAVCAPVPVTIWLVADALAPGADWWPAVVPADVTRIFSKTLLEKNPSLEAEYSFQQDPVGTYPLHGALRCGMTVAGQALQLAHWFGARRAVLCGVDLEGDGYWTGERVSSYVGDHWAGPRKRIQALITTLQGRGMVIESLSKTTLNVRRFAC